MANVRKAKGTTYETACVKELQARGFTSRRLALGGSLDTGDLEITEPFLAIVECKAYKGELTEKQDKEFRQQTEVEALNYQRKFAEGKEVRGLLFVKTPGQSIARTKVHFYHKTWGCWINMKPPPPPPNWETIINDVR